MAKQRKMRHIAVGMLVAIALAIASNFVIGGSPALASGSTVDIGLTIISGNYIKGSGSDYNTGDYEHVCISIIEDVPRAADVGLDQFVTQSQACKDDKGHNWWSAPDYDFGEAHCVSYFTAITGWNSTYQAIAVKNSNKVALPC